MVIDRGTDEDDVIFEQTGIDIVGSFATVRLLDDHGNERCSTRNRVVCLSHSEYSCLPRIPNQNLLMIFGCRFDPGGAVEPLDCLVAMQLRPYPALPVLSSRAQTCDRSRCWCWCNCVCAD